jgi:hypothetical protein
MAPNGGLPLAHEAIGTGREHCGPHSDGRALMITLGLCLLAASIVGLAIESGGLALVLFSAGVWMLLHA